MANLIVVGFKKDTFGASEALNMLKDKHSSGIVDLHYAVTVYRDDDGKLQVEQSYQKTKAQGAQWGGLAGIVVGTLLAASFAAAGAVSTVGAVIAVALLAGIALGRTIGGADAQSWKDDISEDVVQRAGAMLQPKESALFVVARAINSDAVADAFRAFGGSVLQTTRDVELRSKVETTVMHAVP